MDRAARIQSKVTEACRRAGTPNALLAAVQQALREDLPADRWCAMTLDPATSLPTGGVHEHGLSSQYLPRLLELEFEDDDFNAFTYLSRAHQPIATLAGATQGDKIRSARFREVLAPDGVAHELRAVFRDGHGPWAAMVLLRGGKDPAFSAEEIALLAGVSDQVTRAVRRVLLLSEIDTNAGTQAPALLMLDVANTLQVRHVSASAKYWLRQIEDGTAADLPYALHSLAQRARSSGHGVARLRTRTGRWLTAHAEVLPGGNEVSLILQPSRPHEIAQVLAGAYGLTAREAEVARLLAGGCANAEIAELLFVSRYTVEDHLKHLYEKLDVSSRSELVARLFFDQYLPRTMQGLGLDGEGWFMGGSR